MELHFEKHPDHARLTVTGRFDAPRARTELSTLLSRCEAAGTTKLLVDIRGVTTIISIADRYDLATHLVNQGRGKLRIAVVVSAENMFTKTFEDTATNRGYPVRTTTSMEEALAFLQVSSAA